MEKEIEDKYIVVWRNGSTTYHFSKLCGVDGDCEKYIQFVEKLSEGIYNAIQNGAIFPSLLLSVLYTEEYDENTVLHFDNKEDASNLISRLLESKMAKSLKETVRECEIISTKSEEIMKIRCGNDEKGVENEERN